MRLSIIIPVLDSHEIVRRQLIHFKRMELPDDVEVIIVDDGSKPPLYLLHNGMGNLTMYFTNNFNPWTQVAAKNMGARLAKGERLLFSDIDHILSRKLIDEVMESRFAMLRFKREFAVLDEDGNFTQDIDTLVSYGFKKERLATRGLRLPPHSGICAIDAQLFRQVDGWKDSGHYPQREEADMRRKLNRLNIEKYGDEDRPMLYMFPNGKWCGDADYNPFGLFHHLSRKAHD